MINLTKNGIWLHNEIDLISLKMTLGKIGTGVAAFGLLAAATAAEAGEAHDRFETQFGPAISEAGLKVQEVLAEPEVWCHAIDADGDACESASLDVQIEAAETREAGLDKTIATVKSERDAAKAVLAAVQDDGATTQ